MFDFSTMGVFLYFLYPILLISISIYVSLTKETTLESYFFADRNTHWFVLGISFLTSTFFSPYLFGLSFDGSVSGFPFIYAAISIISLLILGWYIAPVFQRLKINTLPEYFEKRFNRSCKYFISSLYVFSNMFFRLLVILIAGNILINFVTGVDAYFSLLFFMVITSIYLIIGGLQAEIYVGIIQIVFIAVVSISLFVWLLSQNGGLGEGVSNFSFLSYHESTTKSFFSIPEIVIGIPILAFWFYCTDQVIIQKVLSAGSSKSIRKASVVSGLFQFIPLLVFILPGITLTALSPNLISDQQTLAIFGGGFLPQIFQGGLFITIAAILIASFAGLFNSTTILITFDFYRSIKPEASDRKLVLVGRLTIMILLCCSILLVPLSQSLTLELGITLLKSFSFMIALVVAVFLVGLLNKKIDAVSALITLITITVIILCRTLLSIFYVDDQSKGSFLNWFINSSFIEFVIVVFLLSVLCLFVFQKLDLKGDKKKSFANA
ncbi:MAG: hypothetical protein V1720_10910 [bacterium]